MPEDVAEGVKSEAFNISVEETIRRLRAKGQPIRLFGESDKDRRLRLRALELIEEKDHEKQGGQNDFRKALEEVESRDRELKAKEGEVKDKKKIEAEAAAASVLDLNLIKTDPKKLYPIIFHALKRMLKEWEESMDERPGRLAA
jgi:pre-mRNA-splicing factor 18